MSKNQRAKSEVIQDFWYNWYCRIIPTVLTISIGIIAYTQKTDFTGAKSFIDLLTAVLTGVTILTGFMASLLGLVIQSRETSPTIKRFFEIAQNKGEKTFITLLKKSVLSGFIVLLLSCILFLHDKLPCGKQEILLLWVWMTIYFGTSTYRFISLFLSMLLTSVTPYEKQSVNKMSDERSEELKRRIMEKQK